MNKEVKEVEETWTEQKDRLKHSFAILTENDLMFDESKKEEILGKVQAKLGKTKEEFQKIIAEL